MSNGQVLEFMCIRTRIVSWSRCHYSALVSSRSRAGALRVLFWAAVSDDAQWRSKMKDKTSDADEAKSQLNNLKCPTFSRGSLVLTRPPLHKMAEWLAPAPRWASAAAAGGRGSVTAPRHHRKNKVSSAEPSLDYFHYFYNFYSIPRDPQKCSFNRCQGPRAMSDSSLWNALCKFDKPQFLGGRGLRRSKRYLRERECSSWQRKRSFIVNLIIIPLDCNWVKPGLKLD